MVTDEGNDTPDGLLDRGIVDELAQLGEDDGTSFLRKLVAVWDSETRDKLGSLTAACERNDPEAVEKLAHSIHGASVSLGASVFAEAIARIESSGRERRLERTEADLARVTELFEATLAKLQQ